MLENELTLSVGADVRKYKLTRYPNAKNTSQGRSCATTDGRSELSLNTSVTKAGATHVTGQLLDQGNFIDGDSNRFDADVSVNIAIDVPAEGYSKTMAVDQLTALFTYLTTVDGTGETPLNRMFDGEK